MFNIMSSAEPYKYDPNCNYMLSKNFETTISFIEKFRNYY